MFNDEQGKMIRNEKCDIRNVCNLAAVIFFSQKYDMKTSKYNKSNFACTVHLCG